MPTIDWPVIISGLLYAALTGILNLIFARKSQIADWAEQNPRLAAVMKFTRAIGLDPWALLAAFQLAVSKKLPDAQKNIDNSKKGPPSDPDTTVSLMPPPASLRAPDRSRLHNDAPDEPAEMRGDWRRTDWRLQLVFGVLLACMAGCGAASKLPCDESKLRAIDAAYLLEVGKACLSYPDAASCPAYPDLRAKHSRDLHEACK